MTYLPAALLFLISAIVVSWRGTKFKAQPLPLVTEPKPTWAAKLLHQLVVTFLILLGFGFVYLVGAVIWNFFTGSGVLYHTERVITDMNPQWMNQEQNSCLYQKGPGTEPALLECSTGKTYHNIPVRFSGPPPDAATKIITIQWKCTRGDDRFSCEDGKTVTFPQ